jgi:Superinfection immunity protein
MSDSGDVVLGLVLILLGLVIYFIPSAVAHEKERSGAIIALNLLLGWTVIGWVGALVWAIAEKPKGQTTQVRVETPIAVPTLAPSSILCGNCGTYYNPTAKFCQQCAAPLTQLAVPNSAP